MSNDFLLGQVFRIPPVTRYIALSIALVTLLVYTDTVSPYSLFYSPLFMKRLEVWRMVTTFLYFGKPTLDVFMHIVFLYRYSRMLEEGCVNTSEYFWLVLVVSSILFGVSNIYGIPMLGTSFSATITYIWTKRNPRAIVQIFGFISFPAFYLPFILPGFMLLSRRSISLDDILGIVVGHIFYYFRDVYPRWGSNVLGTPCWVKRLFGEHPSECCRSKEMFEGGRGMTIGEGRAMYERKKASGNETVVEDSQESGDGGDVSVGENNSVDRSVSHSVVGEGTHSSFMNSQTMVTLPESSFVSTGMSLMEQGSGVVESSVVASDGKTRELDVSGESEEEWDEDWDVENSGSS